MTIDLSASIEIAPKDVKFCRLPLDSNDTITGVEYLKKQKAGEDMSEYVLQSVSDCVRDRDHFSFLEINISE